MRTVAIDTETWGNVKLNSVWDECDDPIRMAYISWWDDTGKGDVYSVYTEKRPEQHIEQIGQLEEEVLANPNVLKVFWNARFDIPVLIKAGLRIERPIVDAMIASQIARRSERHGLKWFARKYLHDDFDEEDFIRRYVKKHKCQYGDVPYDVMRPYALKDAQVTYELWYCIKRTIDKLDLNDLLQLETDVLWHVITMEGKGISVDVELAKHLYDRCIQEAEKAKEQIYKKYGLVNLNSVPQLREYLYGKIIAVTEEGPKYERQPARWTKKGEPSTDRAALLWFNDERARLLQSYRGYTKAANTYYSTIVEKADNTNRIHCSFNTLQAVTGRFSSSRPNLQNLPRSSSGLVGRVRDCYTASDNHTLLAVDYEQLEMRLCAHLTDEPTMIAAIKSGKDLHNITTKDIFRIAERDPSWKNRRYLAKKLGFSINYGTGPGKFAWEIFKDTGGVMKVSIDEARDYIDAYKKQRPNVPYVMRHMESEAEAIGGVRTFFGRWVPIKIKLYPAFNYWIQGTAADIIKMAMCKLGDYLKPMRSSMLLQVHDEIIFEIHESEEHIIPDLIRLMELHETFLVPITCSAKMGFRWGTMVPYEASKRDDPQCGAESA